MNTLHDKLVREYGPGTYLTNGLLDWSHLTVAGPHPSAKFNRIAAMPDRLITAEGIKHGEGAVSCGIYDSAFTSPEGYAGVYLFGVTIKHPGSDAHVLPRQLSHIADLIEVIASTEYAANPDTRDKYCGIMMRTLPLVDGLKQVSEGDWHAHHVLTANYLNANNRRQFLEIDAETMKTLDNVSINVVQAEYLFSDICGSQIQSAPSDVPMDMVKGEGIYMLRKPPQHFRQTRDGEIVRSNSNVFHCAATPTPDQIGKTRTLLFVGYTATPMIENRVRRQSLAYA